MRTGCANLLIWTAHLQAGQAQFSRHANKLLIDAHEEFVKFGSKHTKAALQARANDHTPASVNFGSAAYFSRSQRFCTATPRPRKVASGRPKQSQSSGDAHSHTPRTRQKDRGPRRSSRKSMSKTRPVTDLDYVSQEHRTTPVLGVTDLLLRGTSIPAPALTPASLKGNNSQPGGRSHLVRARPDAPASSSRRSSPSATFESQQPDLTVSGAAQPHQQASNPAECTLMSTAPASRLHAVPIRARRRPWHCALWRATQHIYHPVKAAAACGFPLLQLVMPLPAHHAVPQPALTAHNADKLLPESRKGLWPLSLGSLLEASTVRAHEFPHSAAEANAAQTAFESSWTLNRFAAEKFLPQVWIGELLAEIRASQAAVIHASKSNRVAMQVKLLPVSCHRFAAVVCSGPPVERLVLAHITTKA